MSMILAKYYTNSCYITNNTPCVNMADDANYVKLSLKAQLKKEILGSTEQRSQKEPILHQSNH